jgi:hypothetical protein
MPMMPHARVICVTLRKAMNIHSQPRMRAFVIVQCCRCVSPSYLCLHLRDDGLPPRCDAQSAAVLPITADLLPDKAALPPAMAVPAVAATLWAPERRR